MTTAQLTEAEATYLERVAEDCAELLGPGMELGDVELDAGRVVTLRLSYRLGAAEWTSEGHGENVIAAHADLREQLVLDRIRIGVRAVTLHYR
jgi:hypothetical protein